MKIPTRTLALPLVGAVATGILLAGCKSGDSGDPHEKINDPGYYNGEVKPKDKPADPTGG